MLQFVPEMPEPKYVLIILLLFEVLIAPLLLTYFLLDCKKSVDDHSLLFVHKDGVIKITVEHMDGPLPPPPATGSRKGDDATNESESESDDTDSPIATWTYCKQCNKVVTPLVYISENTWKFSFGKFLEGKLL